MHKQVLTIPLCTIVHIIALKLWDFETLDNENEQMVNIWLAEPRIVNGNGLPNNIYNSLFD